MASFCDVLVSRDILDEICELIKSVSEGFPTYPNIRLSNVFFAFKRTLYDFIYTRDIFFTKIRVFFLTIRLF